MQATSSSPNLHGGFAYLSNAYAVFRSASLAQPELKLKIRSLEPRDCQHKLLNCDRMSLSIQKDNQCLSLRSRPTHFWVTGQQDPPRPRLSSYAHYTLLEAYWQRCNRFGEIFCSGAVGYIPPSAAHSRARSRASGSILPL